MVSGSNPNDDFEAPSDDNPYPTELRTELWYPPYYNQRRPNPEGLLSSLSYGGEAFNVYLNSDDLFGDINSIETAKVHIIRTGFSTHNMNMGQRLLQLETTYTAYAVNSSAVLHVAQLPPNPHAFAPGPAMIFVVVNGVPSVGKMIMIGTGQIEEQPRLAPDLLSPSILISADGGSGQIQSANNNGGGEGGSNDGGNGNSNGAPQLAPGLFAAVALIVASILSL